MSKKKNNKIKLKKKIHQQEPRCKDRYHYLSVLSVEIP